MSDDLKALRETAVQARAKADELKAALTDKSSKEDRSAAAKADTDATTAEAAYADAKAKAEAAKVGDVCSLPSGSEGTLVDQDGKLVCVSKDKPALDPDASRTGFVDRGNPGDACTCPDGRKGTVHKFDNGLICIPTHDQG